MNSTKGPAHHSIQPMNSFPFGPSSTEKSLYIAQPLGFRPLSFPHPPPRARRHTNHLHPLTMAAAVLMRRRLGSSLVDASARLGLGGSVGALVTRRSAVVLHPSAASVTEVAAARPGLGGSVGAFMAKQARVAAASYLNTGSRGIAAASYSTTGARGLAGVGSWASGLRSVGSGASGFRSVMLLPIRSFSKRPEKGRKSLR